MNPFPTFKELYERFGTRPILLSIPSGVTSWEMTFLHDGYLVYRKIGEEDFTNYLYSSTEMISWALVDWFEDDPAAIPTPARCTCDFYSVILVSGCACNGV